MNIPSSIRVGPIAYAIVMVKKLMGPYGRRCGECSPAKSRIRIDSKIDVQIQTVTLWHEILHAILFGAGVSADEHNEQQIDALAYGIVAALRDNPGLAAVAQLSERRPNSTDMHV